MLPATGRIEVAGNLARFVRPGLLEEYSVSVDGVRQDFVVLERPSLGSSVSCFVPWEEEKEGKRGQSWEKEVDRPVAEQLCLHLAVKGARVEQSAYGATLMLPASGCKVAYWRLKVTDANGRELSARMEVPDQSASRNSDSEGSLAILVDDAEAAYPIRIDPTFSDANWISMGGLPGASSTIYAAARDSSRNIYIGGAFTVVGDVVANYIAKWDGSAWSALGWGMIGAVRALAVDSSGHLYAGGIFTTAGGKVSAYLAKAVIAEPTPPTISQPPRVENGNFTVGYSGAPNATYAIQFRTNLTQGTWQHYTNVTASPSGQFVFTAPVAQAPMRVFRVVPVP